MLAAVSSTAAMAAVMAAPAQAGHPTPEPPLLIADATKQPYIDIYLSGRSLQGLHVAEQVGQSFRGLAGVSLDFGGHRIVRRAERWRCDRRSRRFVASESAYGPTVASFGVRTPSCRRRLSVGMARRARRGAELRFTVRDRWRIGDLRLRLCIDPPTAARRCRALRLARDRASVSTSFRVGERGRWRTALHGPGIRIPGEVSVGERPGRRLPDGERPKVLLTGDSMMQGLDGFLSDRLGERVNVFREVVPASGISKPAGVDWLTRARVRAGRVRPDATVVFLGANEGFDMESPSGRPVICCGAGWLGEYTRRVRTMMQSYSRPARGKVFWLQMPQVRFAERHQMQLQVNAAIRRAASGLRGVRIVRLDQVFTPGNRYRDVMIYRGRRVRVRERDGIHLTVAGAEIAAGKVFATLRSAGVVR